MNGFFIPESISIIDIRRSLVLLCSPVWCHSGHVRTSPVVGRSRTGLSPEPAGFSPVAAGTCQRRPERERERRVRGQDNDDKMRGQTTHGNFTLFPLLRTYVLPYERKQCRDREKKGKRSRQRIYLYLHREVQIL